MNIKKWKDELTAIYQEHKSAIFNPNVGVGVALLIVVAMYGVVGTFDYKREKQEEARYADLVCAGLIPDYDQRAPVCELFPPFSTTASTAELAPIAEDDEIGKFGRAQGFW